MARNKLDYQYELYFGENIVVNEQITIYQPTVRNILQYSAQQGDDGAIDFSGENGFYTMTSMLTATPADYDVQLDSIGIRYEDVDVLDFFFSMVRMYGLNAHITSPILGNLDLTTFERYENSEDHKIVFQNPDGVVIDKILYRYMMQILRDMFNLSENKTKWANEVSRDMHLEYEKKRARRRKNTAHRSALLPIMSMLINSSGFKYTRDEVLDLKSRDIY